MISYSDISKTFNAASYFIEDCNIKKGRADKIALYYKDITYTYRALNDKVNQYANYFISLNLAIEQRIGILLPDIPENVFAFWGAIKSGIVPILINTNLSTNDIQYIIDDSRMIFLLTNNEFAQKIKGTHCCFLKKVIIVEETSHFIEQLEVNFNTAPTTKDDIAFWLYTSGSSGQPKGVLHYHHDMVICSELYGKNVLNLNAEDILYSVSKLPFAFGLGNTLFLPFAVGASSVLSPDQNIFDIVCNVNKYKPTLFFAVPTIYNSILKLVNPDEICFDHIRLCISAGEVLPETICLDFENTFHCKLLEAMGTTEMLHVFISNYPDRNKAGSTGLAVSGYTVEVVDKNNNILGPNKIGELFVSGESMMQGYWNRHDENHKAMLGNGMKTGDKFYKDEDGFFWYCGRCIDIFKVNGCWVRSEEIENVLLKHPSVKEAAVEGKFSSETTTKIVCYIVFKDNTSVNKALINNIKRFVKSRIEHFKCPSEYYLVNQIPKGPTGKIKRNSLKTLEILNSYS